MHPNHAHMTRAAADPERCSSGASRWPARAACPLEALERYRASARGQGFGIAELVSPTATSCPASRSRPTSGAWQVYETPGHAPSHVVLHQPDRGLLLSGDHLLGRVSLYYDYG